MTASPSAPRPAPASPASELNPVRPRPRQQAGFTLLELSFMLAAMAGLVLVLAYLTADLFAQRQNIEGEHLLTLADAQVREFAAHKGRLPCPDTNADGVEDCSPAPGTKGFLPYRTLGLSTNTYVVGETPLRYGVYRNSTADADLAVRALRFSPRNSDGKTYPETSASLANSADFCVALATAHKQAVSTHHTYVAYPGGSRQNMAYAIAFAGSSDRDRSGSRYDLLNSDNSAGFQARNTAPATDYDDKTVHRGFDELYVGLKCEVVLRSLDFVADAVGFEEEVFDFAEDNQEAAAVGTILAGVGTGIAAWGLGQSIAEVAGAGEVLGTSIGLLSGAIASCPVPPFVTCALIPLYGIAVGSAGTGVGLAAAGAAANGAAVGLQLTATLKYNDIKSRTGLDSPTTTPAPTAEQQATLNAELEAKNTALQAAENKLAAEVIVEKALINTASNARIALNTRITAFSAEANLEPLFTLFSEQLDGKDTGREITETVTYKDEKGVEKTETFKRPVIVPGAYQALLEVRTAEQAKVSAQSEDVAAAQARLEAAKTDALTKRTALVATADKFDAYDQARLAQAAATTDADKSKTAADRARAYAALDAPGADSGTGGLCGSTACALAAQATAYLDAEQKLDSSESEKHVVDGKPTIRITPATLSRQKQQDEVTKLRNERDTIAIRIGINSCTQNGQDYDPQTKVCTAGAPGSGAAAATKAAVCDVGSKAYDKPTCDALNAAAGTPPPKVQAVKGAGNILNTLRREGVVQ